jgi:hypothetical protein
MLVKTLDTNVSCPRFKNNKNSAKYPFLIAFDFLKSVKIFLTFALEEECLVEVY